MTAKLQPHVPTPKPQQSTEWNPMQHKGAFCSGVEGHSLAASDTSKARAAWKEGGSQLPTLLAEPSEWRH